MRKILTDYFYYSRSERNGIIVLMALSLGLLLMPKVVLKFLQPTKVYNFEEYSRLFIAFQNSIDSNNSEGADAHTIHESTLFSFNPNTASFDDFLNLGLSAKVATTIQHYREKGGQFFKKEDIKKIYGLKIEDYNRLESFIEIDNAQKYGHYASNEAYKKAFSVDNIAQRAIKLTPFNPNTATEQELLTLGLDDKIVKNLLKFREKGGGFYKKEDLKKIYGFSELDYLRVEPYIQIAENHRFTQNNLENSNKELDFKATKPETIIDVNTANFEQWLELRGIGHTFATRIIEQREKLGGFASLDQIKEIHGLSDSIYRTIVPHLKITTAIYRKISINKADVLQLNHPYLTHKQLEIVLRYRMNHGNFKSIADLKKTGVFTDEALEKLKLYMLFD